jgi:hypothetical protein
MATMRTIIRFSVDGERNSALRNKLTLRLENAGFVRQPNTATYEHHTIDESDLGRLLQDFWQCAYLHRTSGRGRGRVDHFWLYSDR